VRGLALGHDLGRFGEHHLVDVAQRDDLDRGDLDQAEQVALPIPARTDQPDPPGLVLGEGRSGEAAGGGA